MDPRQQLREYLVSRRARITPEQAGLAHHGGSGRRVAGLRRAELAVLANVSVEYLTKLERGTATGVSDAVLEAVARALQLDPAETAHLSELVRGARTSTVATVRPSVQRVRPGVQQLLDAMTGFPAFVQNGRLEILAANGSARVLYADLFDQAENDSSARTVRLPSHARFTFLDDRSRALYPDWQFGAADAVALLRAETGRAPRDRRLDELIGELTRRSREFSALWAAHNVRWHTTGSKLFHHRVVGDLVLAFEALLLPGDSGLTLVTFTPEPHSASAEALAILGSWHTTPPVPGGVTPADGRRESPR